MSDFFREGLIFFKEGNYDTALKSFNLAVENNPEDHKAWNAAGICQNKIGDSKGAEKSFETALMLDPNNQTYQKNLEKILIKIQEKKEPDNKYNPHSTIHKKPRYDDNSILLIILFFIPPVCCVINIGFGILVLLVSAYLIYKDAIAIHAGIDPYVSGVSSWSARDWGIIAFLLWIAVPYYIYKRKSIFEENIEYYLSQNHIYEKKGSFLGFILKAFVFLVILCLFSVLVAAFVYGFTPSSGSNSITTSNPSYSNILESGYEKLMMVAVTAEAQGDNILITNIGGSDISKITKILLSQNSGSQIDITNKIRYVGEILTIPRVNDKDRIVITMEFTNGNRQVVFDKLI